LEPTLVVVGLSHRTAAVEVRERFWMSGCRQAEVLSMLAQAEGIDEVIVFSTSNRTEFVLWGDATLAVNSILRLLSSEYDLKLQEWNSFYRLVDEQALAHIFRVACGLDSSCIGEEHPRRQAALAWRHARNAGCTGRHLKLILRKTIALRRRISSETDFALDFVSGSKTRADESTMRRGEAQAEQIVQAEVREFKKQLLLGGAAPELTALRTRLDEICRQELESFRLEQGPFPKDQDRLLAAVGLRITQRIAGSLARDLISSPHPKTSKRMSVSA